MTPPLSTPTPRILDIAPGQHLFAHLPRGSLLQAVEGRIAARVGTGPCLDMPLAAGQSLPLCADAPATWVCLRNTGSRNARLFFTDAVPAPGALAQARDWLRRVAVAALRGRAARPVARVPGSDLGRA